VIEQLAFMAMAASLLYGNLVYQVARLGHLRRRRDLERAPAPEGALVYVFIGAHVSRAIGSMVVYTSWAHDAPYYALDADGTPRRRGTFTTGRPFTSIAYALLGESQVLRFLHLDVPLLITDRHVELSARLIERSASLFREQFGPEQRFVAVAYPEHWPSEIGRRLRSALARDGVEVLDYTSLFGPDRARYFFPEDRHPTAQAHRAVAERLVADLDLADDPAGRPALGGAMSAIGLAPAPSGVVSPRRRHRTCTKPTPSRGARSRRWIRRDVPRRQLLGIPTPESGRVRLASAASVPMLVSEEIEVRSRREGRPE
jgi:hypothetical protein